MKNIFLLSAFVFCYAFSSKAQTNELPINSETNKILYTEVIQTTAKLSKGTIYDRVLSWAQNNKYRITQMDKENGVLYCEGVFPVTYPGPRVGMNDNGFVKFLVNVSMKDGRYKYDITNFVHEGDKGKGHGGPLESKAALCGKYVLPDGGWGKIKKDTAVKMQEVISDLKSSIEPQESAPVKEDW